MYKHLVFNLCKIFPVLFVFGLFLMDMETAACYRQPPQYSYCLPSHCLCNRNESTSLPSEMAEMKSEYSFIVLVLLLWTVQSWSLWRSASHWNICVDQRALRYCTVPCRNILWWWTYWDSQLLHLQFIYISQIQALSNNGWIWNMSRKYILCPTTVSLARKQQ
jgi:hypothetical protein